MNMYMQIANEQAKTGMLAKEGGPFGAVIVDKHGQIIATGNNQVLVSHDPTAHAEIVTIRKACEKLGTNDLSGYILYSSCEPCPMCLSAIIWANIKEVYFGATRKDAASIGFRDDFIYEYLKGNTTDAITIHGIDREECAKLFAEYEQLQGVIY